MVGRLCSGFPHVAQCDVCSSSESDADIPAFLLQTSGRRLTMADSAVNMNLKGAASLAAGFHGSLSRGKGVGRRCADRVVSGSCLSILLEHDWSHQSSCILWKCIGLGLLVRPTKLFLHRFCTIHWLGFNMLTSRNGSHAFC